MKAYTMTKAERIAAANRLIRAIGSHSRRFFYDQDSGKFAEFSIGPRGHVMYTAQRKGVPFHVIEGRDWPHFHNGGTLRHLVCMLAEYIRFGNMISQDWIGQLRMDSRSYIWGYDHESVMAVRAEGHAAGVLKGRE